MARVGKGTRYFNPQVTQRGKAVYYYRRPGFPRIRLDAEPGTAAMDRAYYAADKATNKLAEAKASSKPIQPDRPKVICKPTTNPEYVRRFGDRAAPGEPGSLRHLCDEFMASDEFAALDAAGTQKMYRRNLLKVCALRTKDGKDAYGEWIAEQMKPIHIEAISHQLREHPTVADNCAKALRLMFNWARKHERFTGDNPASGFVWLRPYNDQEEGFFTWEDEHLEAYMVRHPIGSRARMAFALMYYAGVRKSDAFQLGPFHVKARGSELHWTEWKGSRSTALGKHRPLPKRRQLEIHPELARTIAATETGHGRFVLNKYGRPYSYSGFDQAFDDWCDQAGLPSQCTAHGVRKAAAALMYENGASEAELCAIFGWKIGSRMAAYYAKKYNARRAQSRALGRLPLLGGEAEPSSGAS